MYLLSTFISSTRLLHGLIVLISKQFVFADYQKNQIQNKV